MVMCVCVKIFVKKTPYLFLNHQLLIKDLVDYFTKGKLTPLIEDIVSVISSIYLYLFIVQWF